MLLKEIAKGQRPRERLCNFGAYALSDAELLAIILQSGSKGRNVIELSQVIVNKFSLNGLSSLSVKEFTQIKGIGAAKACKIIACLELSRRVFSGVVIGKTINNSDMAANYFIHKLKGLKKEHFYALFLDSKNRVIRDELISVGTLNSAIIHPREIFKYAIKESANSIILVHNHPSGDITPSDEDIRVTKQVQEAGRIIGIEVLDHIITGNKCYYSICQKVFK